MKLEDFQLTLRGATYKPLIIGGMGVDISSCELSLVAARLGGIGHISDAMAPFLSDRDHGTKFQSSKSKKYAESRSTLDKTKVKWNLQDVYQATRNHVANTMNQKRGPGAIFVNVMEKLTMAAPAETLQARLRGALDAGVDGITLSAGLHTGTLKLIEDHPRFRDAAIGIIVSSARALKIFLRSAKRVNRMPDYIVVEGPLAGGHLGFGLDWKKYSLKKIVDDVVGFLKDEKLEDIPVVPAGGVFTGTDAVDYLQSGSSAVQVATRFTISKECGLPDDVKQKYLAAIEDDVVVNLSSPTGYPMRMLKNSPSLRSNIRPNCEALGYLLDKDGDCAYHHAWEAAPVDEKGRKMPISEKMCICHHFMQFSCYTCGHNVYRLKDTTHLNADGSFYLPSAEHIFEDYMKSVDYSVRVPEPRISSLDLVNSAVDSEAA